MRETFAKLYPYLIAVAAVGSVTLLKWGLDTWVGTPSPFLLFYAPILLGVWAGGLWPGVLATTLACVSIAALYPTVKSAGVGAHYLRLLLFAGEGLLVSCLGHALHQAKTKAEEVLGVAQRGAAEARRGEDRQRLLTSRLPNYAVFMLGPQGHIEEWNEGAARIFKYASKEIAGEHFERLYPDEDRRASAPQSHLQAALEEKGFQAGVWLLRKDATRVYVDWSIAPLYDEANNLLGFSALTHEGTERKRGEENLKQSEQDYREFFEQAADAALVVNQDSETILAGNRQAESLYRCQPGELIGKSWRGISRPVARGDEHRLRDRAEQDELRRFELTQIRKDRSEIEVEVGVSTVNYQGGRAVLCLLRDITARRRDERATRARAAVTRILSDAPSLSDAAPLIIEELCTHLGWDLGVLWVFDQFARRLRCARIWSGPAVQITRIESLGRPRSFVPGESFPGRVWENGSAAWIIDIAKDATYRQPTQQTDELVRSAVGFPLLLGDEKLGVIEIFSRDARAADDDVLRFVDDIGRQIGSFVGRRRSEEQRKEREELYRAAFEKAAISLAHVSVEGKFWRFNHKLCETLGYTRQEVGELTLKDVTYPEDLNNCLKHFQQVINGEKLQVTFESRFAKKEGAVCWVIVTLSLVRDQFGQAKFVIAAIDDIHERKMNEIALLDWKRRFEAAYQTLGLRSKA